MRRVCAGLIFVLLTNLIAGCGSGSGSTWTPLNSGGVTQRVAAVGAPAADPGRWDIIPQTCKEYDDRDGWKHVRIPVNLKNRTNLFSTALIPVMNARLHTKPANPKENWLGDYPAQLYQSQGSNRVQQTAIDYTLGGFVPPGSWVTGIYVNDAVSSYYFEARIPANAVPTNIVIPGYLGTIQLGTGTTPTPSKPGYPVPELQRKVEIPGKAEFSVVNMAIMREPQDAYNHPAHDRLSITYTVTNTNPGNDSNVTLIPSAIGHEFILGTPITDTVVGCGPMGFVIGPSQRITRTICSILPNLSHNIKVVIIGDVNEYYEPGF